MMLSMADIECLERGGHDRLKFMRIDKQGLARLKNSQGTCVFYNSEKHRCKNYRHRPSGCRIYPVIYSEEEGIIVDDLCPMKDTVSRTEISRKGKEVMELLQRIDKEATSSRNPI
jgi:Fe-S-cluster containining protein